MKRYIIILMTGLGLLVQSCKQDAYFLFNDQARLQFGPEIDRIYQSDYDLADTTKRQTFYYLPEEVARDTVYFDLYTIGNTLDYDRNFELRQVQVEGASNAVPGQDYVGFDQQEVQVLYRIEADSVHAYVPIILLRDPGLKETSKVLKFELVANAHFELGEVSNLWRKVIFTDHLSQPAAWNESVTNYYLGEYSQAKHQFMIESTDQRWDNEFVETIYRDYAMLQYWVGLVKMHLIDYNNAHPGEPLRDEKGALVTFP